MWQEGKNHSERVAGPRAEQLRQAVEGRQQFEQLAQECIELTVQHTRQAQKGHRSKKKLQASVRQETASEVEAFVALAKARLATEGTLPPQWLELGLREALLRDGRRALEELLNDANWRVEADQTRPGEKCYAARPTTVDSLFGRVILRRNYYTDGQGGGRAPLGRGLGIVEGCTPALARLMCRAGAVEHYEAAADSLNEYSGLSGQWPAHPANGQSSGAADGPVATAQPPQVSAAACRPGVLRRGGRHRHSGAPGGNGGAQRQGRRSTGQNPGGEIGLCLHPDQGR